MVVKHIGQAGNSQEPWEVPGRVSAVAGVLCSRLRDVSAPFQLLVGPRGSNKAGLVEEVMRCAVTCGTDPALFRRVCLESPTVGDNLGSVMTGLVGNSTGTLWVFLEELVGMEMWDLWLKDFYDRRLPVRLMATVSAKGPFRTKPVLESGIGRWEETHVGHVRLLEKPMLAGRCLADTLRAAVSDPANQHAFPVEPVPEPAAVEGLRTAIREDLQRWAPARPPTRREQLAVVVAGSAGRLDLEKTSRRLGATVRTVRRDLALLEKSCVLFGLPNFGAERDTRWYFTSPGLVSDLAYPPGRDRFFKWNKNAVASRLWLLGRQEKTSVSFWRDGATETDFVYHDPRQPLVLAVGTNPEPLRVFAGTHPRFGGHRYLVSDRFTGGVPPEKAPDRIGRVPAGLFLAAVAHHHENLLGSSVAHRHEETLR